MSSRAFPRLLVAAAIAFSAPLLGAPSALADNVAPVQSLTVPEGKTVDDVKAAILSALTQRHWLVQEATDSRIIASYSRHPVIVSFTIGFDSKKIDIEWKGSGPAKTLEKKRNQWASNFVKDVTDILKGRPPLAAPVEPK